MEDLLTIENPCSREKIAPHYRPIVSEAVAVYTRALGTLVREIRLMGSVPRGDAVAPFSDIDFIALLSCEPTADQKGTVGRRAAELTKRFGCVSKVDLEVVVFERVGEARTFILTSDSVHLWGEDLYAVREQHISRRRLADLLTPNLEGILKGYQESVRDLSEDEQPVLLQWSRWSGKDILKCLRRHALLAGGTYERTIRGIHDQLRVCMPEHVPLLEELYELYVRPEPNKGRILSVLAQADAELPRSET